VTNAEAVQPFHEVGRQLFLTRSGKIQLAVKITAPQDRKVAWEARNQRRSLLDIGESGGLPARR
jgi:hypothetical protein